MRRKKRYKHTIINKKSITSIKLFGWITCRDGTCGHRRDEKIIAGYNAGIHFAKDKNYVDVSSYDADAAVFSDRNCFPRSIIVKMEELFRNCFWFGCNVLYYFLPVFFYLC